MNDALRFIDHVETRWQTPKGHADQQLIELRASALPGENLAIRLSETRKYNRPIRSGPGFGGERSHLTRASQIDLDPVAARHLLPIILAAIYGDGLQWSTVLADLEFRYRIEPASLTRPPTDPQT